MDTIGKGWRGRVSRFPLPVLVGLLTLTIAACQQPSHEAQERRPEQAGQPVNPYKAAGHLIGARAAVVTGNTEAAEQHIRALAGDMARSARIRDVARPIDREAARAAVRPLAGVRSAIWLDADNLIVMVDGRQYRSRDMIDEVCLALEPLGDTLGVVVNLQDVKARNGDEATTLSRNCQLPDGERAFMQAKRQVDVVAPEVRKQFKEMQRNQ